MPHTDHTSAGQATVAFAFATENCRRVLLSGGLMRSARGADEPGT